MESKQSLQRLAQEAFGKAAESRDASERSEHLRTCRDLLLSLLQVETDEAVQERVRDTLAKVGGMLGEEDDLPSEGAQQPTATPGDQAAPADLHVTERFLKLPGLERPHRVLLVGPQGNELGRHARYLAAREHGAQRRIVLCGDAAALQALDEGADVGLVNLDETPGQALVDVLDTPAGAPVFAVSSEPWRLPATLLGRFGTKLHVAAPDQEDKRRLLEARLGGAALPEECLRRFHELTCGQDSGPLVGVRSPPFTLVDVGEVADLTAGQAWSQASGTVISSGRGSGRPLGRDELLLRNAQSARSSQSSLDHDLMAMFAASRCCV